MDYHADAFSAEEMSWGDVEKVKERIRSLQSKSWRDWTEDDLAWAQAFRAQYQSFTGPRPRHGGAAATEPQPSLRRLVGALKRGISAVYLTRQRKQNVHFSEQAEIDGSELVTLVERERLRGPLAAATTFISTFVVSDTEDQYYKFDMKVNPSTDGTELTARFEYGEGRSRQKGFVEFTKLIPCHNEMFSSFSAFGDKSFSKLDFETGIIQGLGFMCHQFDHERLYPRTRCAGWSTAALSGPNGDIMNAKFAEMIKIAERGVEAKPAAPKQPTEFLEWGKMDALAVEVVSFKVVRKGNKIKASDMLIKVGKAMGAAKNLAQSSLTVLDNLVDQGHAKEVPRRRREKIEDVLQTLENLSSELMQPGCKRPPPPMLKRRRTVRSNGVSDESQIHRAFGLISNISIKNANYGRAPRGRWLRVTSAIC